MKSKEEIIEELLAVNEQLNIASDEMLRVLQKIEKLKRKIGRLEVNLPAEFDTKPKREAELRKRIPHTMEKMDMALNRKEILRIKLNTLKSSQMALQSVLKTFLDQKTFFEGGKYGIWKRNKY